MGAYQKKNSSMFNYTQQLSSNNFMVVNSGKHLTYENFFKFAPILSLLSNVINQWQIMKISSLCLSSWNIYLSFKNIDLMELLGKW
jgi:hypothetical protein